MADSSTTYQFMNPQGTSNGNGASPTGSTFADSMTPDSLGSDTLSIALIGPDDARRMEAARALLLCDGTEVREYAAYPSSLDEVPRLLEQRNDAIIIDLDSNPEFALELVEAIGANGPTTVMVYSSKSDPDMLVRCMRAGAREFLTPPFAHATMAEALVRAQSRRAVTRLPRKTGGRLLVFLGAKGAPGLPRWPAILPSRWPRSPGRARC
jgi:pilus assembly protein CpaE